MKRPDMMALYAPVASSTKEIANQVLDFFLTELRGHLDRNYARVMFDPEEGSYRIKDEALDLDGREDLLRRLDRDVDCEWGFYVYLVFYPSEVDVALFRDTVSGTGSTLMLTIDPKVTKSFEEEEEARMPFVIFLVHIAQEIGSNWFVSGPHIDEMKTLRPDLLNDASLFNGLYIIGWKPGVPEEDQILAIVRTHNYQIKRTTLGYNVVLRYE